MPKDVDDDIPNVAIIINDKNVLSLAHLRPTTLWLVSPDCDLVEAICR